MNNKDIRNIEKDSSKISLGKIEDSRVFFILKKTEKISSALFMITDVFNNSHNVLKKEVQEATIVLLKDISKISTDQIFEKENIKKVIQSFLYIKSLIEVSQKINCISDNNASILFNEINFCINRIEDLKNNPLQLILNTELKSEDFISDYFKEEGFNSSIQDNDCNHSNKRQIKDIKKTLHKDTVNKTNNNSTSRSEDKLSRQSNIKSVLINGGEMSIKDITDKIDGVSSKTIQRDLNEMIKSGIVIKEGEKRWSVYKIK